MDQLDKDYGYHTQRLKLFIQQFYTTLIDTLHNIYKSLHNLAVTTLSIG